MVNLQAGPIASRKCTTVPELRIDFRYNRYMVLAAALLLAQSSPLTFQSEAITLRKLMPELAKITGLPLVVSPEVEWQVVYVRVKDVASGDLLKQIAKVTFGTWETTSDGRQILKRDAGALSKLAEEKRKSRLVAIEASIKQAFDPKSTTTPTHKALARMAQKIGAGTLAGIGEGQRMVFSSSPTQMQRAMPALDVALYQELILSHNKEVDKQAARGTTEMDEEMKKYEAQMPPEFLKMMKEQEEAMRPKRINGQPAKIDLAFANQYGVSVKLTMYDAKGDEIAAFQTSLQGDYDGDEEMGGFTTATSAAAVREVNVQQKDVQEEGKKPEPDKSPVIKLTKEAAETLALTYYEEGGDYMRRAKGASESLKKLVAAVGEKDPFLSAQTEVLNGYAEHVKDNLVINVADHLMDYRSAKQITVNAVEEELMPDKANNWSIVIPDEFEPRVDRDLMVAAVAKIKLGNELEFEDKAWLAGAEDRLGGPNNSLMDKIYTVYGVSSYMWRNKPLLKLYGMLNQAQRNSAVGKGLPLSGLSPDQRRLVERICYSAELYVKPMGGMEDFDEELMFSMDFEELMKTQMSRMTTTEDYLNEPTESMPSGVPNGAVLLLTKKSDPVFMPITKGDGMGMMDYMGDMGGMSIDMLTGMMSMGEMMGQPEIMGQMPTEVKPATRSTLTMKLICTDKVGYQETHRSAKVDAGGKPTKITDLPDFAAKMAKRKEMMKKWKPMFDLGFGMGRRSSPPPQ